MMDNNICISEHMRINLWPIEEINAEYGFCIDSKKGLVTFSICKDEESYKKDVCSSENIKLSITNWLLDFKNLRGDDGKLCINYASHLTFMESEWTGKIPDEGYGLFSPIDEKQIRIISYILDPISNGVQTVKNNRNNVRADQSSFEIDSAFSFTKDQKEFIDTDYKGPVLVLSGAGGGKTAVLLAKGIKTISKKKDAWVLAICRTHNLYAEFEAKRTSMQFRNENGFIGFNYFVNSMSSFIKNVCNNILANGDIGPEKKEKLSVALNDYWSKLFQSDGEEKNKREVNLINLCLELLEENGGWNFLDSSGDAIKFDAILIDEVQMFTKEQLNLLYKMLRDEDSLLLMTGDVNQTLIKFSELPWNNFDGKDLLKKHYFYTNFRNSPKVKGYLDNYLSKAKSNIDFLRTAPDFEGGNYYFKDCFRKVDCPDYKIVNLEDPEDIKDKSIFMSNANMESHLDFVSQNVISGIQDILKRIDPETKKPYQPEDITILFPYREYSYSSVKYNIQEKIWEKLKENKIEYTSLNSNKSDSEDIIRSEYAMRKGVCTANIEAILGLDFKVVILCGLYPCYRRDNRTVYAGASYWRKNGSPEHKEEIVKIIRTFYAAISRARDTFIIINDIPESVYIGKRENHVGLYRMINCVN